jgi:pimeloyl-ACP methyl ester carboxylesterase
MPRLNANGIEIEYETFGDSDGAPMLLVMGLGAQLLSWDEEFCGLLAGRGFHVIRYDNRDSGLSTKMESAGAPDLLAAFGGNPKPAY